jgi:hypothetical protein
MCACARRPRWDRRGRWGPARAGMAGTTAPAPRLRRGRRSRWGPHLHRDGQNAAPAPRPRWGRWFPRPRREDEGGASAADGSTRTGGEKRAPTRSRSGARGFANVPLDGLTGERPATPSIGRSISRLGRIRWLAIQKKKDPMARGLAGDAALSGARFWCTNRF